MALGGARITELNLCGGEYERLYYIPDEVASVSTQLTKLNLSCNPIGDGWENLPTQLLQLDLSACALQQLPAELARCTLLKELHLSSNDSGEGSTIKGGWQNIPRQLQKLDLGYCSLTRLPELASLTLLSELELSGNRIAGGNWERLLPSLQRLTLFSTGLQQAPAELAERELQIVGL